MHSKALTCRLDEMQQSPLNTVEHTLSQLLNSTQLSKHICPICDLAVEIKVQNAKTQHYSGRFCRAMLCISTAIAGMRCPSLCPSVTFVSCAKTNKDIFEIFSPSGSHTILVFHTKRGALFQREPPPNRGVECKGYEKINDFRPISRCISETVIVRWVHAAR